MTDKRADETHAATHSYLFDVKLFATLRIHAESEAAARAKLAAALDCVSISCSDDGDDVLTGEATADGEADLVEVDGEMP